MQAQKSFADKMSAIDSYTKKFNKKLDKVASELQEHFADNARFLDRNAAFINGALNSFVVQNPQTRRDTYLHFTPELFSDDEILTINFTGINKDDFNKVASAIDPLNNGESIDFENSKISIKLTDETAVIKTVEALTNNNIQLSHLKVA